MFFTFRGMLWGICLLLTVKTSLAFETIAKSAIILDLDSNITLMEKNADMALPPASMSKLMTLNMVFEALEDGRLQLDQTLPVSEHAQSYDGSTMFLTTQDKVSVEQLIRGVVVLSGNDASAVLAEALSPDGTERGFADMMTKRAKAIGMTNSSFANSNGMPAKNHRMSTRDLAILAQRLISEFPQYYGYFAETEFNFNDRAPANRFNRNPLLAMNIGADGLKTGHTKEAGYGLVGSAMQGDRRIIFAVSGISSKSKRAKEANRLATWAFRQFTTVKLAEKGQLIGSIPVWLGPSKSLKIAISSDIELLVPALEKDSITSSIVYQSPISAPILVGSQVAELIVSVPGFEDRKFPIVAGESIEEGSFMVRFKAAAEILGNNLKNRIGNLF